MSKFPALHFLKNWKKVTLQYIRDHGKWFALLIIAGFFIWYPVTMLGSTTSRAPISGIGSATTLYNTPGWAVQDSYASAFQDEPWMVLIGSSMQSGSIPVISMFNGLGAPLLTTMQAGVLYPGNMVLPFLPLQSPASFDIFVLLHQLLFVCGLYVLYERWTHRSAAAVVALLVGYSGVAWQNINMVHFRSLAWLPWILAFSFLVVKSRRPALWIVPLAGVLFAHISAGSLQDSIISLSVCALITAFYWMWSEGIQRSVHHLVRVVATYLAGALLSAFAVIPFFAARSSDALLLQEGGFRVLQSVNWYYMMSWIVFQSLKASIHTTSTAPQISKTSRICRRCFGYLSGLEYSQLCLR